MELGLNFCFTLISLAVTRSSAQSSELVLGRTGVSVLALFPIGQLIFLVWG